MYHWDPRMYVGKKAIERLLIRNARYLGGFLWLMTISETIVYGIKPSPFQRRMLLMRHYIWRALAVGDACMPGHLVKFA